MPARLGGDAHVLQRRRIGQDVGDLVRAGDALAARSRCGGSPAMSSPSNRMRPLVGRSTPVRQLKKVLLPAPFGPMMARISPRGTSKLTLSSAVRPPKRTVRPSVRRMGGRRAAARPVLRTGAPLSRSGLPAH